MFIASQLVERLNAIRGESAAERPDLVSSSPRPTRAYDLIAGVGDPGPNVLRSTFPATAGNSRVSANGRVNDSAEHCANSYQRNIPLQKGDQEKRNDRDS